MNEISRYAILPQSLGHFEGEYSATHDANFMMTSSNGNIFRLTGPLCREFTGHRCIPLTKASDTELWCLFDLRLNKRSSRQLRRRWFEMPLRSLWRHCIVAYNHRRASVIVILPLVVLLVKKWWFNDNIKFMWNCLVSYVSHSYNTFKDKCTRFELYHVVDYSQILTKFFKNTWLGLELSHAAWLIANEATLNYMV